MKIADNLYIYSEKGTLDCNTYVITTPPGVIIDPGARWFLKTRVEEMREDGIDLKSIGIVANTHLHGDHCGANESFKKLSGARITLHRAQKQFYQVSVVETAQFFNLPPTEFAADESFEDDKFSLDGSDIELIHCPGHSPDSICFYLRGTGVLFSGDVIFQGNIGRSDLPGGDAEKLAETISMLEKLDIEYLMPGHMGIVAGRESVKNNFKITREMLNWM